MKGTYACLLLLIGCGSVFAGVDHVDSASGEVVIRSAGPRHVLVLVDTASDGRDGLVDQWFILESAENFDTPLSADLQTANLVFYPGSLRVTSPDQRTIYEFAVPDHEERRPAPQHFRVVRRTGIGLSHVERDTPVRISTTRRNPVVMPSTSCAEEDGCYPWAEWIWEGTGGTSNTCDSGGPGSTSCSASGGGSSCSVSCSAGYYACCTASGGLKTCKCIKG
jgi:hypothetical protein